MNLPAAINPLPSRLALSRAAISSATEESPIGHGQPRRAYGKAPNEHGQALGGSEELRSEPEEASSEHGQARSEHGEAQSEQEELRNKHEEAPRVLVFDCEGSDPIVNGSEQL